MEIPSIISYTYQRFHPVLLLINCCFYNEKPRVKPAGMCILLRKFKNDN